LQNEIDRAEKWLQKSRIGKLFSLFDYGDEQSALSYINRQEKYLIALLARGPGQISDSPLTKSGY